MSPSTMGDLATKAAWEVLPAYKEQVEQLQADAPLPRWQRRAVLDRMQAVKMEARHVNASRWRSSGVQIVFVRPGKRKRD